ncbi:MAG: glycosyltransferase family 4 protein [Sphingomonadaceae bacterium]|nr:glycosyltransferase family 4 protein [Sphingomonadaceae bacterium]
MTIPTRPRILFVGAFPPPGTDIFGGMVSSCRALMQSSFPTRAEVIPVDTTQIAHPPPSLAKRLLLAARRAVEYVVKLERERPDAVILFTAAGASVLEKGVLAWYARLRGVPALLFPRGGPVMDACERSRVSRTWIRWAMKGAHVVVCQGPVWQDFVVDLLGIDRRDAPVIPNWTATTSLLDIGAARRPRLGPPRLLFVGWLDREKGVTELLDACGELAASHDFELIFVGEGNMSDPARRFAADRGLEDRIRFRGWLRGDALDREYAEADIFVLPSWSEGLPNAMIEAMAAGMAVVVSAVGNVPSAIDDGVNGVMVRPGDVPSLRNALTGLLVDPGERERLGANAHRTARDRFGVEAAVDRILAAVAAAPLAGRHPSLSNGAGS